VEYNQVTISGFKSILDEQSFHLGALTIFSGANSGGKSSAIQPLLLLKQTLESQYDPGTILLY
jgi:predicted ATPase